MFKKEFIHCVPDESLIGKRVLYGDTYKEIIEQVGSDNWKSCRKVLIEIDENKAFCPFGIKEDDANRIHYRPFVYYDPEWNEETIYYCYLDRDDEIIQFMYDDKKPSSYIYATFTDEHEATKWCNSHDKFAEIAKAWEDGKTIQYCEYGEKDWCDCEPCWDLNVEYRVKPDEETVYYCYLDKDGKRSCFSYTSKKPDTHIYAKFTRVSDALDWCYNHNGFAEIAKAWEDGKTIQFHSIYPSFNEEWLDCANSQPSWDLNTEYRIKPDEPVEVETSEGKMYLANGAKIPKKRRMTNRELAKWLAQSKGQWRSADANFIGMTYSYGMYEDAEEVLAGIMIRDWDETEWHEPEVEMSV